MGYAGGDDRKTEGKWKRIANPCVSLSGGGESAGMRGASLKS
jgi:hypothetical protein